MEKLHVLFALWITITLLPRSIPGNDISPISMPSDKLQEPEIVSLLGLKLALENEPNGLSRFLALPSRTTIKTSEPDIPHRPYPGSSPEVRIYAQTSGNQWSVVCEAESMQLNHNVHLVCPLMQPRCFENCKRICEPTGCVREPSLAGVSCVARQTEPTPTGGFVRRFEYQIDKYDQNITGNWSCFFAGSESEKIMLKFKERTTTTLTTTIITTKTTAATTTTPVSIIAKDKTSTVSLQTFTQTMNQSLKLLQINDERNTSHAIITYNNPDLHIFQQKTDKSSQTHRQLPNETDAQFIEAINPDTSHTDSAVPFSTFLTYITSNLQIVLGFMALLALSLLTNLVFCLQFLRITRRRVKTDVEQPAYSTPSNDANDMNNSTGGSFKLMRPSDSPCYSACRPVSWISPIANNSALMDPRRQSGCAVTGSKSCHFASLSLQLGAEQNTLINPVTSTQYRQIPSVPLRYWTASPMTTSLYQGAQETCETTLEQSTRIESQNNLWTNSASAMKSSCSFSSNGLSMDDPSGGMHRSITLPFSRDSECSQLPLPVYVPTMTMSRTPSQSSVGVRLLPSYGMPQWYTPTKRSLSKVRLLPKACKVTEDGATMKRARFENSLPAQYPVPLVLKQQSFPTKSNAHCNEKSKIIKDGKRERVENCCSNGQVFLSNSTMQHQHRFSENDKHKTVDFNCLPSGPRVLNVT